jgi:hypothetical protein
MGSWERFCHKSFGRPIIGANHHLIICVCWFTWRRKITNFPWRRVRRVSTPERIVNRRGKEETKISMRAVANGEGHHLQLQRIVRVTDSLRGAAWARTANGKQAGLT